MHQTMQTQVTGCTQLGTICLSKHTCKQTKSLQQLQRGTLLHTSQIKAPIRFYQITLSHDFGNDTLITVFVYFYSSKNLQIRLNDEKLWRTVFDFGNVEANSISNRGQYVPICNLKSQKSQSILFVEGYAFCQSLKLIFCLKKDFQGYCQDHLGLKRQKTKAGQQQNITRILRHTISSIKIYGFNIHSSPAATQLIKLLNISIRFKKNKRHQQQAETDILLALSLINARRFIQASQLLRKTTSYFVNRYNSSKSHLQSSKYERSWMKEYQQQNVQESLNMSRNYSTGRVLQGAKYLFKAAKIQLLLAQTISHPSLRTQKLEAYNRSNSYFNGNPAPLPFQPSVDIEEVFFKIGPNLIVFLMKVLYDKSDVLRITALKSIQFIYETLGCSLSQMVPPLIKTVLITYPSNQCQETSNPFITYPPNQCRQMSSLFQQAKGQEKSCSNTNSLSKNRTLIDSYHHLLETFIGLIPLMNKKYLRSIFKEIIVPNLSNVNNVSVKNQLKLYLLRFSQKILSLCLSDLDITTPFISAVISFTQKKILNSQSSSKYTIHNITFFSQRIIEFLKIKILPKYSNSQNLTSICSWINQNLVYFCQNQITQQSMQFFSLLIDFILIIYTRPPIQKIPCPVEPIIYFMNMSINQQFLPFEKLLSVMMILLKYIRLKNGSQEISCEIVQRIMAKAKMATLNVKELKILQSVLKMLQIPEVGWLIQFLDCIPHSTFDQIYSVFSILFQKSLQEINKGTLEKTIHILLDQYTVKGKAHQSSKNNMIQLINNKNQPLIKNIFQICLTENSQPIYKDYEARKKRGHQHITDTKMYKVHYQLFVEKLQLLILFIKKNQSNSAEVYKLFAASFVKTVYLSLKKLLQAKSSKIKHKALRIINSLNQVVSDNIKNIKKVDLFYVKAVISLLKNFIVQQVQSKLQFQAIFNLGVILNLILKQDEKTAETSQQSQLDFMDGNIQDNTQFQVPYDNIQTKIPQIRFRQFVKIYPAIVNLLNSPWQNIKELIIQTIIQFFSKGLLILPQNYQRKTIEVLKPLLSNYMHSPDYSQRFGASKIVACLLGLSRDYTSTEKMAETFHKSSKYVKIFVTQIFNIQQDWHEYTNKTANLILRVTLSVEQQQSLRKKIQNWKKTQQMMQSSFCVFNLDDQLNTSQNKFKGNQLQKNSSSFSVNNLQNLQTLLKDSSRYEDQNKNESNFKDFIQIDQKLLQDIAYFKSQILKVKIQKSSFFGEKQSFFVNREEQHCLQSNEDKAQSLNQQDKQKESQDQPLQFEDLGIIDLDDDQWGQEENQVRIMQKLPLKKIYKLSPNIGSSTKHQRIRSKRYFSHEFDPIDKIIVDQLEGKINQQKRQRMDPVKPQFQQRFIPKFQSQDQSLYNDEKIQQNQSNGLEVRSEEQIQLSSQSQRTQRTDQKSQPQQRLSNCNKVKKGSKKRKSSISK